MAKYTITAPDGNSYDITAPEGASQEDVLAYAKQNYKSAASPSKSWGQAAAGEASTVGNRMGETLGKAADLVGSLNIPSTLGRFAHPLTNDNNEFSQQVQQAGQQLYKQQQAQVESKTAGETPLQRDVLGSVAGLPNFAAQAALGPSGLAVAGMGEGWSNSAPDASLGNKAGNALAGGAINTIAGEARINSLMSPSANVAQAVGKNALAGGVIGMGANAAQQGYDATVNGKDFSGSDLLHSGIGGVAGGVVGGAATHPFTRSAHPTYWTNMVNKNADKTGVDSDLANRVLFVESSGNPDAKSGKGAMGLMQLTDPALKDLGLTRGDIKSPAANIRAGVQYLGKMIGLFGGDEQKGVAAYNAGQGAVNRAIAKATAEGNPDGWMLHLPSETQAYLGKIFGADKGPMTHDQWVQHVASNPENNIMSKDQWFQDRNSGDRQNPLDEGYSDYVNRRIQEEDIQKPANVADAQSTPQADRLSQTASDSFMGRVNAATDDSTTHPYDPNAQSNGHDVLMTAYREHGQPGETFQQFVNRVQDNRQPSSEGAGNFNEQATANHDPNVILPAEKATTTSEGASNYAGTHNPDEVLPASQATTTSGGALNYNDGSKSPIILGGESNPAQAKFDQLTAMKARADAAASKAQQSGVKQHKSAATRHTNALVKAMEQHGVSEEQLNQHIASREAQAEQVAHQAIAKGQHGAIHPDVFVEGFKTIGRGIKNFGQFVSHMVAKFGDGVRSVLKPIYDKAMANLSAPTSFRNKERGAILAWHGSHRDDINRFSNKYIGSGEGAQAFGHGLYFAGNKRTAEHYQESISQKNGRGYHYDGKKIPSYISELIDDLGGPHASKEEIMRILASQDAHHAAIRHQIVEALNNPEHLSFAKARLQHLLDAFDKGGPQEALRGIHNLSMERAGVSGMMRDLAMHLNDRPDYDHIMGLDHNKLKYVESGKGGLYKVDLEPDHNTLLHWDRPFSEQTKHVQDSVHNALQKLIFFHRKHGNTDAKEAAIDLKMALEDSPSTISGEKVYRSLTANLGSDKHASNWLSNHGVDGIKYLDAISRHDHHPDYENSTEHNYVMFNDKHVKILKAGQEVTNRTERLKRIQELKNNQAMKSAPPEVKVDRREDLMTRLRRQNDQSVRMAGFGDKQRGSMTVPFGGTAEALRKMWENRHGKTQVQNDTSKDYSSFSSAKDRLIHDKNGDAYINRNVKDQQTGEVKSSDVSWMNRKIFSKGITPDWLAQMNKVVQWPIRQVMKVKDNNYNASHGLIDEKLAGYDKLSDEEKIHVAKLANYFDHHRIDPTSQSVAQTLTSPKWGGTFKASSKAQEFYLKAMEAGKTTLARVNAQRNMAGMPEIQAMPGHWPHLWKNGDFSVEVHDTQGNKVHQEKFDNRISANKAQLRLKKQFPNHEVSAPKEVEPQDLNHRNVDEDALWGAKQLADHLNASQDVRDFLNRFESEVVGKRGYGVHSVQRKNVGGYLGDHADPRKAADEYVESLQRDIHSAHTYAGNLEIGRTVGDYVSKLGDEHKNARGVIYDYLHAVNSSNAFSKVVDSAATGLSKWASFGFLGREMNVLSRSHPMKFIRWANIAAMHSYLFFGNIRYLAAAVKQPLINTNLRILQLGSEGMSKSQFHAIPEAIKADAMAVISLAQYHTGNAPADVKDFIDWAHKNGATGSRFIDDVMPGIKGKRELYTGVKIGKMAENEGHLLSALMMYHYLKGKQGFSKSELYEGAKEASIQASGRFQKWGKVMALNMMGNKGEAVGAMKTWVINALSQQVHMLRMLPKGKAVPILGYMAAQWYMTGLMGFGYRDDVDAAIEAINKHFNTTFPTLSEKMRGMSDMAKFGPEQATTGMQHNQTMKGPGFTDLGDMVGLSYAGKAAGDAATLGAHWVQGVVTDADKEKALTDILPASMHGEIENYFANKHNPEAKGLANLFQTPTAPISDPSHRDQGRFYRNGRDNLARMLTTRSNREVNTLEGLREAQAKEAAQQKSTQAIVSTMADGMRNGTLSQLDMQHLYQKAYENGTDPRLLMRDAMNLYKNGYKTNALRFVGNLKTLDQRNKYNTLMEMGIDPFALGGGADSYD